MRLQRLSAQRFGRKASFRAALACVGACTLNDSCDFKSLGDFRACVDRRQSYRPKINAKPKCCPNTSVGCRRSSAFSTYFECRVWMAQVS